MGRQGEVQSTPHTMALVARKKKAKKDEWVEAARHLQQSFKLFFTNLRVSATLSTPFWHYFLFCGNARKHG